MTASPTTTPAVDYPDAVADAERAVAAGFDIPTGTRLINYVAALNLADKVRQAEANAGIIARAEAAGDPDRADFQRVHGHPRQSFYRLADPVGRQRYLRVVDVNAIAADALPGLPARSVEAFVEIATGLVYKPDGWKRPAKGARYSLATDEDAAKLIAVAGQYAYLYRAPHLA